MSKSIEPIEQESRSVSPGVVATSSGEPPAAPEPAAARLNQALSQALGGVVQSGHSDQLRGYANEAVGGAKLAVGLAIRSPELALAGLAQGALGAVQRYVGEAKMAAEAEARGTDDEERDGAAS